MKHELIVPQKIESKYLKRKPQRKQEMQPRHFIALLAGCDYTLRFTRIILIFLGGIYEMKQFRFRKNENKKIPNAKTTTQVIYMQTAHSANIAFYSNFLKYFLTLDSLRSVQNFIPIYVIGILLHSKVCTIFFFLLIYDHEKYCYDAK